MFTFSVCFNLYLRNCRSYHQDFDITGVTAVDITGVFIYIFLKKCNIVNIKIILFFCWPNTTVF